MGREFLNIELQAVAYNTVGSILENLGYSKQSNQKMLQLGKEHPDRNVQFEYINATAKRFLNRKAPVISVTLDDDERWREVQRDDILFIKERRNFIWDYSRVTRNFFL
jgi:hypothetical protein